MDKKHSEESKQIQSRSTPEPEIDYSPKAYTSRAQLASAAKQIFIGGAIVLLFWLITKLI